MRKIKVGIIQQANTSDIRINLMNLAKSIEASARQRIRIYLNWQNPFLALLPDSIPNWRQPIG